MARPTVLVVDDDQAINKLVQTQLDFLGFDAVTCADIDSAKRLLTDHSAIECILSDLNMPGGTGLTLAKWVQDHHQGLPMYLMTGQPNDLSQHTLSQYNITQVLIKPFQIRDLALLLQTQFGSALTPPLYPSKKYPKAHKPCLVL